MADERPPVDPLREAAQAVLDELDIIRSHRDDMGLPRVLVHPLTHDALRAALASAAPRPEGLERLRWMIEQLPVVPGDYTEVVGQDGRGPFISKPAVLARLSDTGEGEQRDVRRRDCGCLVDDNQTLTLCDTHSDTGEGEK